MLDIFAIVAVVIGIVMVASTPDDEYDNHYPDNEI